MAAGGMQMGLRFSDLAVGTFRGAPAYYNVSAEVSL
jgi:hypothetical protein